MHTQSQSPYASNNSNMNRNNVPPTSSSKTDSNLRDASVSSDYDGSNGRSRMNEIVLSADAELVSVNGQAAVQQQQYSSSSRQYSGEPIHKYIHTYMCVLDLYVCMRTQMHVYMWLLRAWHVAKLPCVFHSKHYHISLSPCIFWSFHTHLILQI